MTREERKIRSSGNAHHQLDSTVRLPATLKKELERLARNEKASKSDIIRNAVERCVAVRRFRALRAGVLPFAEAQGILTDEDVIKALS